MDKQQIQEKIDKKQRRLDSYLAREEKMLNDGVQSYGIGSRNVARYQTDLSTIRSAINQLETEVEELQKKISGQKPRKSVAVVPTDW